MPSAINSIDGLTITSDVMYENFFPITEIKKHSMSYKLMGEPMPITIRRMARDGRKSPITKKTVHLEVGIGASGQLCTSDEACRRFIERLNGTLE